MKPEECYVGQRVIVGECFAGMNDLSNKTATVVTIPNPTIFEVGIEFDEDIRGHDCGGKGKYGHCLYGYFREIEPLCPEPSSYDFNFTFDNLFLTRRDV